MGAYNPGTQPARMVPRYPDEHDVDEAALENDPARSDVPTHIRVLEKVRAAYADKPAHILRHEETKDGLDKLIQIVDDDRHPPPFDFEPPIFPHAPIFPKPPHGDVQVIDKAEHVRLVREAGDAKVLRAELERITAELHQLRKTHDALLIKSDAVSKNAEHYKGMFHTAREALGIIADWKLPYESYGYHWGAQGVREYMIAVADAGYKGLPPSNVTVRPLPKES